MARNDLRDLGFPEAVVVEVEESERLGLFELQPAPDAVEQTMKRIEESGAFYRPSVKDHVMAVIRRTLRKK
ncbi:MAG: hypothetical protein EOO77_08850 [Oxalobacteraceae bacterium]|nr:MAG: hypothetical protein EOO77_08850 [Oxalobacteraceae bacterium]